ncbi:hypothetical protein ACFLQT_00950 [Bacteroidota bacterium]
MKKWIKVTIIVLATPVVLFLILLGAYIIINLQGVIEPFQVGYPDAHHKILIASQGSEFKNTLTNEFVELLNDNTNYISIVDCTSLDNEAPADWDAIIIIHTTQIHGMPDEARRFLSRASDLSKIVLITTSGGGDETVTEFEIDAISTASRLSVTNQITDWAIAKLDRIFENEIPTSGISSMEALH